MTEVEEKDCHICQEARKIDNKEGLIFATRIDHEHKTQIQLLEAKVEKWEKLFKDTLSWRRSERDKPNWWDQIIINIGDVSWEQACLLEEGVREIIQNKLSKKLNAMWSYEQGRDAVDTLKVITDLLGRVQYAKQYAYSQYQEENEKKREKKQK